MTITTNIYSEINLSKLNQIQQDFFDIVENNENKKIKIIAKKCSGISTTILLFAYQKALFENKHVAIIGYIYDYHLIRSNLITQFGLNIHIIHASFEYFVSFPNYCKGSLKFYDNLVFLQNNNFDYVISDGYEYFNMSLNNNPNVIICKTVHDNDMIVVRENIDYKHYYLE